MTVETVCNQALDLIGYKRHIGSLYEGTRAARVVLDVWSLTRDALFSNLQPGWARADAALTLIASAPPYYDMPQQWNPTYPDMPWLFEYDAPADCLVPLQIKPRMVLLPVWRPRPISFRAKRNGYTQTYTILTNQPEAVLTYIRSVHDPDTWDDDFTEAMIMTLAKKLQPQLAPQPQRPAPKEQGDGRNAA